MFLIFVQRLQQTLTMTVKVPIGIETALKYVYGWSNLWLTTFNMRINSKDTGYEPYVHVPMLIYTEVLTCRFSHCRSFSLIQMSFHPDMSVLYSFIYSHLPWHVT